MKEGEGDRGSVCIGEEGGVGEDGREGGSMSVDCDGETSIVEL